MSIRTRMPKTIMMSDRFAMSVNLPKANKSGNRRLPPHAPTDAYLCDEYVCPNNWIESSGRMASYFLEVAADKAMWLDFTMNQNDTHDVAIVISVQGVNTITGMPQGNPQLEQYIDSCPKCQKAFQANRFCQSCGYKWPKQNYLASTSGKTMWIDGFRALDGVIRQYVFTEESSKGVAAGIIGDQRVYAIGVAFFTSKNPKPKPESSFFRNIPNYDYNHESSLIFDMGTMKKSFMPTFESPNLLCKPDHTVKLTSVTRSLSKGSGQSIQPEYSSSLKWLSADSAASATVQNDCFCMDSEDFGSKGLQENVAPKLEVGAGNEIDQEIGDDPNTLDYWNSEPSALICVNYCNSQEMRNILSQKKHIEKATQGFLTGVPVT